MEVRLTAESPQTQSPEPQEGQLGKTVDRVSLAGFLGDPDRANATLNLFQAEGFLFAVACCPQDVEQQEWLQIVLGDDVVSQTPDDELGQATEDLLALYADVSERVRESVYRLPGECTFSWDAEERRPLEQWCEGLLLADQWLEALWMDALGQAMHRNPSSYEALSRDLDDTIGIMKIMADMDAALEVLEKESASEVDDFRQQLRDSYDVLDQYLAAYMHAGNGLSVYYHSDQQIRQEPKIGRNDACPCGSGKKYKKCCLT